MKENEKEAAMAMTVVVIHSLDVGAIPNTSDNMKDSILSVMTYLTDVSLHSLHFREILSDVYGCLKV
jgi:hypothetical protein